MIQPEHKQVLKTLYDAGLIDHNTMQTIRGQIMSMDSDTAEHYLKRIIKNRARKAGVA